MNPDTVVLAGRDWPVARCRDCGAPMVWAMRKRVEKYATTLKPLPLDIQPVTHGDGFIVAGTAPSPRLEGEAPLVRWAYANESTRTPRYTTHWATCRVRNAAPTADAAATTP